MSTENTHQTAAADQPTPLLLVVLAWLIVASRWPTGCGRR